MLLFVAYLLWQLSIEAVVRAQELYENRGGRPGLPSLISLRFLWTYSNTSTNQELCENRGGRPGLPSLISLRFLWTYSNTSTNQELCENRGGRPGLPFPNKPTVSVDVKQHFNQPGTM